MTPARREELRALEAKATRDWTYEPIQECLAEYMSGGELRDSDRGEPPYAHNKEPIPEGEQGTFAEFIGYREGCDGFERRVAECNANGAFIVAARTAIPELLDALDEAERENESVAASFRRQNALTRDLVAVITATAWASDLPADLSDLPKTLEGIFRAAGTPIRTLEAKAEAAKAEGARAERERIVAWLRESAGQLDARADTSDHAENIRALDRHATSRRDAANEIEAGNHIPQPAEGGGT